MSPGMKLFNNIKRRNDPRPPARAVRYKRFLIESAIVENNGIRAEQITQEMQGRHVRDVGALISLRPAWSEYDFARDVSLQDRPSNVVDDAQDFGCITIMLDEREGIFFGAGVDVHANERANDGVQQTNRVQID